MRYNINQLLRKIKNREKIDLSLYKDPMFCKQLQEHALEHIRIILYRMLEQHHAAKTILQEQINAVDHQGFSILDYCLLAGLKDETALVIALGGELSDRLDYFWDELSKQLNVDALPPALENLINLLDGIEVDQDTTTSANKISWKKYLKQLFSRTRELLNKNKAASILLLVGAVCLIVAPFTVGAGSVAGSILISAVAIPAVFTAATELHSSYVAKLEHTSLHDKTVSEQENLMLLKLLDDVIRHEKILLAPTQAAQEQVPMQNVAVVYIDSPSESANAPCKKNFHEVLFHLRSFARRHPEEHREQVQAWRSSRQA